MEHVALAAGATLVALAFAMCTFERWLARRHAYDMAWSVALAFFAVASGALAAGAALGWDGISFRLFYLFGAIVNVPVLALGTAYLLGGRRWGHPAALGVAVLCAFAAGVVTVAPFTSPLPEHELARGSEVFGPLPRILAATCSGVGAAIVLAGAVASAVRHRNVAANLLIAAGTLVTGASGLLNSVFDEMTAFAVTLLAGVALLFAGFLVATTPTRPAESVRPLLELPPTPASTGGGAVFRRGHGVAR